MKRERHEKILEILKKHDVETQEELISRLREAGFETTQATVSRDIRELRLTKATGEGGRYKYVVNKSKNEDPGDIYSHTLQRSIKHADHTMNMVVVHTFSGMAQAVAAGIDAHDSEEILGCVAGDDTILIILKDERSAEDYYEKITGFIN